MTILQSLAAYYDRLSAKGEVADEGYMPVPISFVVEIDLDGSFVALVDIRNPSKNRLVAQQRVVPKLRDHNNSVDPFLFWDSTRYALGATAKEMRRGSASQLFDSFRERHEVCLNDSQDEGLRALLRFLRQWRPEEFEGRGLNNEALDTNIVFRLHRSPSDDPEREIHLRQAARAIWNSRVEEDTSEGTCLATGERAALARLHPSFRLLGEKDSAPVVSFNELAFDSYEKAQGENAPVSKRVAFSYGTALNKLLKDPGRRVRVGDATAVFWADASDLGEQRAAAAESFFGTALNPDDKDADQLDAGRMRAAMEAISKGRAAEINPDLDPRTRMHVLGLCLPNPGRTAVRFWHVGTLGDLAANLAQHWRDLEIDPNPFKRAPAAWALLYETALQRKAENIPPKIGGDLMRAVLDGGRYPLTLLTAVIGRIRADGDANGIRAAICKAVIQRNLRLSKLTEDIPVALDKENVNPAYRLGRLFALYEWAETGAEKRNATIRDKFFASASSTPARVFPLLMRGSTHNLSKLRKGSSVGLAVMLDKEITDVLGGLSDQLPASLPLEEQGRFVVGYYHQMQMRYRGKAPEKATENTDEQEE
ncbi:MAG: type I-C CRISPR-associated protein Cas8c/Csd1 [Micropepsaceae bacterium]